jgi:hypothetical protein
VQLERDGNLELPSPEGFFQSTGAKTSIVNRTALEADMEVRRQPARMFWATWLLSLPAMTVGCSMLLFQWLVSSQDWAGPRGTEIVRLYGFFAILLPAMAIVTTIVATVLLLVMLVSHGTPLGRKVSGFVGVALAWAGLGTWASLLDMTLVGV